MRRSRVEREDLPTPQQDREGKESKQAEMCTWVCAKCLGNSSTKMPLGRELVATVQEGTCCPLAGGWTWSPWPWCKAREVAMAQLAQSWSRVRSPNQLHPIRKRQLPAQPGTALSPAKVRREGYWVQHPLTVFGAGTPGVPGPPQPGVWQVQPGVPHVPPAQFLASSRAFRRRSSVFFFLSPLPFQDEEFNFSFYSSS